MQMEVKYTKRERRSGVGRTYTEEGAGPGKDRGRDRGRQLKRWQEGNECKKKQSP